MAILYGLTDQGLVVKSRLVIRDDINTTLRLIFGVSIDLSDRSVLGQLVGIIADRLGEIWELVEQVASSQDPDKASKAALDALCQITGTFRPGPVPSTVTLTLTGVDSTPVAAASQFATASTQKTFVTKQSGTLAAVPVWTTLTPYSLGDRVAHSSNAYQCIQAGTSAASGGPVGTSPDATLDGGVFWTFLGLGAAAADVPAQSVDLGPVVGTAKDITQIVTSIGGLQGVTNLVDALPGRLAAEDVELRSLRISELGGAGSTPLDALRGDLLQLPNVTSVTLFPNNTDSTDADGVPPHAIEALVRGGTDQAIFDGLLAGVAAGIATHGNTSGTSIDSQGVSQAQAFSRAVSVPVFARLQLVVDATLYPSDGDAQVQNALIAYGAAQNAGRDAVPAALISRAFRVAGVLNVAQAMVFTDAIAAPVAWLPTTSYTSASLTKSVVTNDNGRAYICISSGTSAGSGGPTGTGTNTTDGSVQWAFLGNPVEISSRQLADYIVSNVVVTSTAGTP